MKNIDNFIQERLVINSKSKINNDQENTILKLDDNITIELPIKISISSRRRAAKIYECIYYSEEINKLNETTYTFYDENDESILYANKNELTVLFEEKVAYIRTIYGRHTIYLRDDK